MQPGAVTADGRARVLADGNEIPLLGLGVWQVPNGPECENAVRWALELGYRHIDTAQAYGNEQSVGRALRDSGVPRDEVFITTKFNPSTQGPGGRGRSGAWSGSGVDQVDLYIVHWPQGGPTWAWPGMERAHERGYARSIGVSNFSASELDELTAVAETRPVVNQVQFSPFKYRRKLARGVRANATWRSRRTARSAPAGTSRTRVCSRSPSAWGARRPRCYCAGACSAISSSSRSRRTATGSRRTPRSSTSRCPTRTWPRSTRSTRPAAPTARSSAGGGNRQAAHVALAEGVGTRRSPLVDIRGRGYARTRCVTPNAAGTPSGRTSSEPPGAIPSPRAATAGSSRTDTGADPYAGSTTGSEAAPPGPVNSVSSPPTRSKVEIRSSPSRNQRCAMRPPRSTCSSSATSRCEPLGSDERATLCSTAGRRSAS